MCVCEVSSLEGKEREKLTECFFFFFLRYTQFLFEEACLVLFFGPFHDGCHCVGVS